MDKLRIKAVDDSDNFKQNGSESSNSRKAVKKAGPKDLGCHPFEEISSKNDKIQKSEIQLSPAAFARTIAEVCQHASQLTLRKKNISEFLICPSTDQ